MVVQGRRRVLKSGMAIERHQLSPSAKGTSGGEHERGHTPLVRGVRGISPEKILKFKMPIAAILMHFKAIFACEIRLIKLCRHYMKLYSNVFRTPPPKYEQLFRPFNWYHQAVASKFIVTKSNDSYFQHVLYVDKV